MRSYQPFRFSHTLHIVRAVLVVGCTAVTSNIALHSSAVAATAVRVTSQPQASSTPAIAYGPQGRLSVAWSDTRDGNAEVYYCALDAWGNRLTADVKISNTTAASVAPRLGVDSEATSTCAGRSRTTSTWPRSTGRATRPSNRR